MMVLLMPVLKKLFLVSKQIVDATCFSMFVVSCCIYRAGGPGMTQGLYIIRRLHYSLFKQTRQMTNNRQIGMSGRHVRHGERRREMTITKDSSGWALARRVFLTRSIFPDWISVLLHIFWIVSFPGDTCKHSKKFRWHPTSQRMIFQWNHLISIDFPSYGVGN